VDEIDSRRFRGQDSVLLERDDEKDLATLLVQLAEPGGRGVQLIGGHVVLALFRFVVIELVRNPSQGTGRIDEAPPKEAPRRSMNPNPNA